MLYGIGAQLGCCLAKSQVRLLPKGWSSLALALSLLFGHNLYWYLCGVFLGYLILRCIPLFCGSSGQAFGVTALVEHLEWPTNNSRGWAFFLGASD